MESADAAATVSLRADLHSQKAVWEENSEAGNYFCIWNGQHRHLRQLFDPVHFWVIITHRNAGHVRLWSAERCHVAFKLLPLSHSPANKVGAMDFCPSTLQTSCLWHSIPLLHNRVYEMYSHLRTFRAIISSLPTKCSPKRTVKVLDMKGKAQIVHLRGFFNNTKNNLSVHYPSYPLLSAASPDFNYLPSGM